MTKETGISEDDKVPLRAPIPPQYLMFNKHSRRYRCCAGATHLRTGALAVGAVESIGLLLLFIITIGDYHFYSLPLWKVAINMAIVVARVPAVVVMVLGVYHEVSSGRVVVAELGVQASSVVGASALSLALSLSIYRIFHSPPSIDRSIHLIRKTTYLFLLALFTTIQLWFLHITYRVYNYLLDKKFQIEYWGKPVYV